MRLLETTRTVAEAATQVQLSSPPAATTRHPACDPRVHDCRWWPYSNSGEFGANAAMVVVILLCALICALALNTVVRCFLRATAIRRGPSPPPSTGSHHVQVMKPSSAMMVYYSSSSGMMMKLNECPICLSEFVEGEGVRVLERCQHGFHARCIDTWLSGHSSCPTCRATCFTLPPPPPPPNNSSTSAAGERGGVGERDEDRQSGTGRVDVDGGPMTTGM